MIEQSSSFLWLAQYPALQRVIGTGQFARMLQTTKFIACRQVASQCSHTVVTEELARAAVSGGDTCVELVFHVSRQFHMRAARPRFLRLYTCQQFSRDDSTVTRIRVLADEKRQKKKNLRILLTRSRFVSYLASSGNFTCHLNYFYCESSLGTTDLLFEHYVSSSTYI